MMLDFLGWLAVMAVLGSPFIAAGVILWLLWKSVF